jgi:hypothetical protein
MLMASDGQASTQVLHSVHFSLFTTAISESSRVMASSGHSSTQVPQLTHSSLLTTAGIIDSSNLPHWQNSPVIYPIYSFRWPVPVIVSHFKITRCEQSHFQDDAQLNWHQTSVGYFRSLRHRQAKIHLNALKIPWQRICRRQRWLWKACECCNANGREGKKKEAIQEKHEVRILKACRMLIKKQHEKY